MLGNNKAQAFRSYGVSACLYLIVSVAADCLVLTPTTRAEKAADSARLPERLSLSDALSLLRTRGYDVLLAEVSVRSARAQVVEARAIANPQLNAGVGLSFCTSCGSLPWSAGISDQGALTNGLFGKRALRVSVAETAFAAVRFTRDDALRMLEFQLKSQYVEVAVAQRVLDFSRDVARVYDETLQLTQIRLKAGAVSEGEVAKARTAALEAAQDVTSAEQALEVARAQLAFLLGERRSAPTFSVVAEVLDESTPPALTNARADELLRVALAARADLKAARSNLQSMQASVRVAQRSRVPDVILSVQASGQGVGPNAITPPSIGVGVAVTPPLWYNSQGEISYARAQTSQAELERRKLEAQVAQDVNLAFANYKGTQRRLERMHSGLLESARLARDLVHIQYEKGAASLLELLDAQRTFISNNLEYLRDGADLRIAIFQIEQATGKEMSR